MFFLDNLITCLKKKHTAPFLMQLLGFPFCKLAVASTGNCHLAFAILAASGKHILLLAIVPNPASIYAHEQMGKFWRIIYWHHEILAMWTKSAA